MKNMTGETAEALPSKGRKGPPRGLGFHGFASWRSAIGRVLGLTDERRKAKLKACRAKNRVARRWLVHDRRDDIPRRGESLLKILFGGLGVAVFTFTASLTYDYFHFRSVGPDYVDAVLRTGEGNLAIFIRNRSDEALDLVAAELILASEHIPQDRVRAYRNYSHVYTVTMGNASAEAVAAAGKISSRLSITHAIEPGEFDSFAISVVADDEALILDASSVQLTLLDIKGNLYQVVKN
jgi:hypothetical protein